MRPSEIYRHKHEGELPVYCIKHEDFSCYDYVFYITTTPYLTGNTFVRQYCLCVTLSPVDKLIQFNSIQYLPCN